MIQQVDELFKPEVKSSKLPVGIEFRLATLDDASSLADLMLIRNPCFDYKKGSTVVVRTLGESSLRLNST